MRRLVLVATAGMLTLLATPATATTWDGHRWPTTTVSVLDEVASSTQREMPLASWRFLRDVELQGCAAPLRQSGISRVCLPLAWSHVVTFSVREGPSRSCTPDDRSIVEGAIRLCIGDVTTPWTQLRWNTTGVITGAVVVFPPLWFTTQQGSSPAAASLCHEVGHAIGLWHDVATDPPSCIHPTPQTVMPSRFDLAELAGLYGIRYDATAKTSRRIEA